MRPLCLAFGVLALALVLTGCQGFLEDYNYNLAGAMQFDSNRW